MSTYFCLSFDVDRHWGNKALLPSLAHIEYEGRDHPKHLGEAHSNEDAVEPPV